MNSLFFKYPRVFAFICGQLFFVFSSVQNGSFILCHTNYLSVCYSGGCSPSLIFHQGRLHDISWQPSFSSLLPGRSSKFTQNQLNLSYRRTYRHLNRHLNNIDLYNILLYIIFIDTLYRHLNRRREYDICYGAIAPHRQK